MAIKARYFFPLLFALLLAARLCHLDILWAEEGLPLAAAEQMARGKALYLDIWFDKPPLVAATYLLWGGRDGFPLRLAGVLYALLACWIAWLFAQDLSRNRAKRAPRAAWIHSVHPLNGGAGNAPFALRGRREAFWAAGLMAFYLVFDIPSAVTPLAADMLMLVPHVAAVWLAWRGRTFWSGVVAGLAFLFNAKGLFVLASCAVWNLRAMPLLLCGFAVPNALAAAWLWSEGALAAYWEQVWTWGRVYASVTFLEHPAANGLLRTANWLGFHAAPAIAAVWFWLRDAKADRIRWIAWCAISFGAVAAGWRFFPRYYLQLLPLAVVAGTRGFALLDRRRAWALAGLLAIPFARFGPRYALLARDVLEGVPPKWVDVAMDQDSRKTAGLIRKMSRGGDTLFVWGFRPELYCYTWLPAASRYLDSQPLTGVPADRHLTQSRPVESEATRARRAELAHTHPRFIVDGLGGFNPALAMGAYPDLQSWLAGYREAGRTGLTRIYERLPDAP